MKNVDMKVEGQQLTITVNLAEARTASASGKSFIIASTEGNVSVPGHEEVKIGLNLYVKK